MQPVKQYSKKSQHQPVRKPVAKGRKALNRETKATGADTTATATHAVGGRRRGRKTAQPAGIPVVQRAVSGMVSTPFQRSASVGSVLMPVPVNLAGKTCNVSSAMVLLEQAISDEYLRQIQNWTCPEKHLPDNVPEQRAQRARVTKAWERLRNSICAYQIALRNSQGQRQLNAQLLVELIEASYVFGRLTNNFVLLDIFPFQVPVEDEDASNFLLEQECLTAVRQADMEQFFSFICDVLDFQNPVKQWSGYTEAQGSRHFKIANVQGEPIAYTRDLPRETSLCIDVPLDHPTDGSSVPRTLNEFMNKWVVNSVGEPEAVTKAMAREACQNTLARIRISANYTPDQKQELEAEVLAILRAIPTDWDEARLRIHGFTTRWHIPEGNDTVIFRFKAFRNQSEELGSIDWGAAQSRDTVPEGFRLQTGDQPGRPVKEYYMAEVPKGQLTGGKHYVYNVMPTKHAAAYRLSRAIYEMANFPVADVRPVNRGKNTSITYDEGKKTFPAAHMTTEVLTEREGRERFDYNIEHVHAAMNSGAWHKSAIVFDALLGNTGVSSTRLAKCNTPNADGSDGPRTVIYRTDFFGCLGFSKEKGDSGNFGLGASSDLEALRKDPAFASVTDDDIRLGMEQLSRIKDNSIYFLVNKYYTGFDDTEKVKLASILIARRDNLLAIKRYKDGRDDTLPSLAPPMRGKRHVEAVSAFTSTNGELSLPQAYVNGQKQPYQAKIRTVVCHQGPSMHDGHYIAFREEGGVWGVSDDLSGLDAVPINEYLQAKELQYLVDQDSPSGWDTLVNVVNEGSLAITPYMMAGQRLNVPARPECEDGFTTQRVLSWRESKNAELVALEAEQRRPEPPQPPTEDMDVQIVRIDGGGTCTHSDYPEPVKRSKRKRRAVAAEKTPTVSKKTKSVNNETTPVVTQEHQAVVTAPAATNPIPSKVVSLDEQRARETILLQSQKLSLPEVDFDGYQPTVKIRIRRKL